MSALDCGHPATPSSVTPGYATVRATGRRICYACADEVQRAELAGAQTFGAYVSTDGRALTTWTGGQLARVLTLTRGRRTLDGRMTYVTAQTPDGRVWRGSSGIGEGGAITMRTREVVR